MKSMHYYVARHLMPILGCAIFGLAQAKDRDELPVPILLDGIDDRYLVESGILANSAADALNDKDNDPRQVCDDLPKLLILATPLPQ